MNRTVLTTLAQRLQALTPSATPTERVIWLCAQVHAGRAESYLNQADTARERTQPILLAYAEREAATAGAYAHAIEIARTSQWV